MPSTELVYFGPPSSFTHIVAQKLPGKSKLVSRGTIREVFDFIREKKSRRGIVPIENSSGGMILDTIDGLVAEDLTIQEEFSINVRLALLGKEGQQIKKIYSHFAPLHHCEKWIRENYPTAETVVKDSTSAAAKHAAKEKNAAAIAPVRAAAQYKLDVLNYPINENVPNVTQFFLLGHGKKTSKHPRETSLSVVLKNKVGSLQDFLTPFAAQGINLRRIMSRNIVGQPKNYIFFIGVEASLEDAGMKKAMNAARKHCSDLRILGSYPVHPPFEP